MSAWFEADAEAPVIEAPYWRWSYFCCENKKWVWEWRWSSLPTL